MPERKLKIADLVLDAINPRNDAAKNQREALQHIIDDQDVKLAVLAEDIVEAGLNPMDRLMVLKDAKAGNYIVLEGNRRTAALKILSNPAMLASLDVRDGLKKRLTAAAKTFDKKEVEPIAAFEVENRVIGNRWIQQRHTGENNGRGIVAWTGIASRRFTGTDPALQALEVVRKHGGLTDAQLKKLEESRYITTLDRLLSTPDVRKAVGLDIERGKLVSELPADEVIKPLRRMILDLAEKRVNVTELKRKEQQLAYVKGFDKDSKPDLSKKGKKRAVADIPDKEFTAAKAKPKRKKTTAADRKTIVPKGCSLNVVEARIADIFNELRVLKLEETPNAIAVLLRVFLELSVDVYLKRNSLALTVATKGGGTADKNLAKKVEEAADHMIAAGAPKKDFNGVKRAISVKSSPLSIDLLHSYLHQSYATPSPRELRAAWDNGQPFFERIWP